MSVKPLNSSPARRFCIERGVPIARFMLDTFYGGLGELVTLLGVSPTSVPVVGSAIKVAKALKAPAAFVASLNQVGGG